MKKTGGKSILGLLVLVCLVTYSDAMLHAADVAIPNNFQAGQPAIANDVNDNFTTLADAINENRLASFYGDGSGGDLDIPGLQPFLPSRSTEFANCTIQAGQTVPIFSGSVIRCRGDFINNGTLNVQTHTIGGGAIRANASFRPAHPGRGRSPAESPGNTDNGTVTTLGPSGGEGVGAGVLTHLRRPGPVGGGSGTAGGTLLGGSGGGTLTIITAGTFTNNGTIDASAADPAPSGGGGGGGGILIIASGVSYSNSGTITVAGGNGGAAQLTGVARAPGGGGGGGFIHVITPLVFNAGGTEIISGGLAGDITGGTTLVNPANTSYAGGGGGGSFGNGGSGGGVAGTDVSAATSGSIGRIVESRVDPLVFF